jgi:hypothetical protein
MTLIATHTAKLQHTYHTSCEQIESLHVAEALGHGKTCLTISDCSMSLHQIVMVCKTLEFFRINPANIT